MKQIVITRPVADDQTAAPDLVLPFSITASQVVTFELSLEALQDLVALGKSDGMNIRIE